MSSQDCEVETRALNQAVKRNIERFPDDFMFRITTTEWSNISSQFVMTSRIKRPIYEALTQIGERHDPLPEIGYNAIQKRRERGE